MDKRQNYWLKKKSAGFTALAPMSAGLFFFSATSWASILLGTNVDTFTQFQPIL